MGSHEQFTSSELIEVCAASNDPEAWREFIARFQLVIAASALKTGRRYLEPPPSQVEDWTQDTLLKLCADNRKKLRSFAPQHEAAIYGFLKVVAANVVHDHFKSRRTNKRGVSLTEVKIEDAYDLASSEADSFDLLQRSHEWQQVEQALATVTAGRNQERKRTIFWMHHRQGLTATEIASIPAIGLSTMGVESILRRARNAIIGHIRDSCPPAEMAEIPQIPQSECSEPKKSFFLAKRLVDRRLADRESNFAPRSPRRSPRRPPRRPRRPRPQSGI